MAEYHLTSPLKDEDVMKLKLGDTVYLSGNAFTCRSRLQKYIFDEGVFANYEKPVTSCAAVFDGEWTIDVYNP